MIRVLTIVDLQNDFVEGGALAVKGGLAIVPFVNKLTKEQNYDKIIITQDWHPKEHISFASRHGKEIGDEITVNDITYTLWPDHCIENTIGASLVHSLEIPKDALFYHKATDKEAECYSCFSVMHEEILENIKKSENETAIFDFVGLASDYCIYFGIKDMVEYVRLYSIYDRVKINLYERGCAALHPENIAMLYSDLENVEIII